MWMCYFRVDARACLPISRRLAKCMRQVINFDINPVVAVPQFLTALPTPPSITPGVTANGTVYYTVQINYYDPSIEG